MGRMFGERINEFVLSVDTIGEDTFKDLLALIYRYVSQQLEVSYFSVLDETTINDEAGLKTLWSSREDKPSYTISKGSGYTSHTTYTYGMNEPIWVVGDHGGPLSKSGGLQELWRQATDLPPYNARGENPVCTSVMHPLRKDGRPIGVVEFASAKCVRPTPASLLEVKTLAMVISNAYQMYEARRYQRDNTRRALQMLEGALESHTWTRLALPQMFIAYPGYARLDAQAQAAHKAVIDTIMAVVKEYESMLKPVPWEGVAEAGNITAQVIRDIRNAEYGLCYFSEPIADGRYQDNANVLFEAGMMQALANDPNPMLRGWIPIRERECEGLPFDIAAERMLLVDRVDGVLDSAAFAAALRQRLDALVAAAGASEPA